MKRSLYRLFLVTLSAFLVIQFLLTAWQNDAPNISASHYTKHFFERQDGPDTKDGGHLLCSRFSRGASATSVWRRNLPQLIKSLHHPRDENHVHGNWTRDLLNLLTPHVLQNSIKGYPESEILDTIVSKLSKRIQTLIRQHKKSGEMNILQLAPPLKIAVFGGSIVEGTGCLKSPIPGGKLDFETLQECAWPFRLERALNFLLNILVFGDDDDSDAEKGGESRHNYTFVQVYNLAAGGTNSEAAIPVLKYWLSPILEPSGADIIVNAYSANDNLPPAFHATQNTTVDSFHLARILKRNMQFVQEARFHKSPVYHNDAADCRHSSPMLSQLPMILYVNDYLGNQQESILGDTQLDQAVQWLADMEPTMGYVSISHSIRHWVWADTTEEFFSPSWIDRKGRPTVNVHYGMAGHVTTTIGILYYFLQSVLNYCDDNDAMNEAVPVASIPDWDYPEDLIQIDIPTKEWVQKHQPKVIVPVLKETSGRHVGKLFQATGTSLSNTSCSPTRLRSQPPCAFAFLAAPLGTHQRQDSLDLFLNPFTVHQDGWEVQNDFRQGGFQNKLGLVALRHDASLALAVPAKQGAARIRVVTIHYLKSYGEFWNDSLAEFRARILSKDGTVVWEQVWQLEGDHDQEVSISYFHSERLSQIIPKEGSFQLKLRLIRGKTFKINALMFCSR